MDASRYFMQAKYLSRHGFLEFWLQWGNDISAWTDLPLIPCIYGIAISILGEARYAIQIVTTFFFSGAVLLIYMIGRAIWDDERGFTAALLLLCFPYLLLHIPIMMVDLATMFFLLLAIYFFIESIGEETISSLLISAITIVLAMLTKYSNWLFLSILPVITLCFLHESKERTTLIKRSFIILLLILLIWIPFVTDRPNGAIA